MSEEARRRWDQRYRDRVAGDAEPARVLREFAHLLPSSGAALDLACGLGGNALFLARYGLRVDAWDISAVAVDKLGTYARAQGLGIDASVRDLDFDPLPVATYDVITISRFLDRSLCPAIAAALRPGGLLFYQTYVRDAATAAGPSDPAHRLARNELLHLFDGLTLLSYREEGTVGDLNRGWRDEAFLVARAG